MKQAAASLVVFAGLLGCQPRVLDALDRPSAGDASPDEGAAPEASSEGGAPAQALAYYSFNEGTGSVVHDDSGHGHDGTLLGGAWTDAGRFGGAIQLSNPDAGTDYGIVVDPFPQATGEWSVSFWLKVNASDLTGVTTVLSTEIPFAGGWEVNVQPKDSTFGSVQLAFWIGSEYAMASCACLQLGSWTHMVGVVGGSPLAIQLFQDGVATASAPAGGTFRPGNPYLYMGRWGGDGRRLVGELDEVAIFDRALTAAEVAELYAGVVP